MNMWCHLPTGFNRRYVLQFVALASMIVALITTLIVTHAAMAVTATNRTISFQGRLLSSTGAVVPDGHYNIQFKIYQDGPGTGAGNPGGSLKWTEAYVNNGGTGGVMVKNGAFSVSLGSKVPFGSSIDWNHDTLWLSMNVAGSATGCAAFGSAPCAADGEMLPMKRITASPYAINAGAVGGKTADNFVQLAQGVQTDASTNTSSIHINKTGSGNLVQLQNTGTDIFTIGGGGDLTLGSNDNKTISVAAAADDTDGKALTLRAGLGGDGSGSNGGDLVLQGGNGGGTSADGGNIVIDAGTKAGGGSDGSIAIGSHHAAAITIGSSDQAIAQTINVGSNATAGSTTTVTVGSGAGASAGTTTVQAKNSVTIATNGTTRATFSDTANTVYFGNGVTASAPSDFTIQGTDSSAAAVAGGSLTVQGGNATTGDANGGNITISGGSGSGTGANGLVVLTTPAFSTVANDANCYTSGTAVANSCTITGASVNTSSAVIVGFSAAGRTATLPDPAIATAGRVMYVMAGGSHDFTLAMNGGATTMTMHPNTAVTLLWNGNDWVAAGGSNAATLQDAYTASTQNPGTAELTLAGTTGGLTLRDSDTQPVGGALLEVQNAGATQLFSVNSKVTDGTEHAADGTVHDSGNFTANWTATGSASVSRITSDGQESGDSAQVIAGTAAGNGAANNLALDPLPSTAYGLSVYAKLTAGTALSDLTLRYTPDGGNSFVDCADYNTQTVTNGWTHITCTITTGATAATDPAVVIVQPTTAVSGRTFLIDALSFTLTSNNTPNVKVGTGAGSGQATLFTLDKNAGAPTSATDAALLGSMYYDTTLGKVQCYEADGWGACGAGPDTFVTISPEYANAVKNGSSLGTMTSDLCSDALNINDGSASQPTICGSNETFNFYKWTSTETSAQTKSIYVTYQLPANFKQFVAGSTLLMGRTDSADANVTYQVYRNNSDAGLEACGSAVAVSTGVKTTWQKAVATGSADPSSCGFEAGDSIVIKINLSAQDNANAYTSNLGFTFNNN